MTRLMFFEPEVGGHRVTYFNDLIDYAARHPELGEVIFAINPKLVRRLKPEVRRLVEGAEPRLRLRQVGMQCSSAPSTAAFIPSDSCARWNQAISVAREVRASHVFFAELDKVLGPMAFVPLTEFAISGVHFRPSCHFPEYGESLVGKLRQRAKKFLLQRYLQRRDTVALLSLDPLFTEFARNGWPNGEKVFVMPPEPVIAPGEIPPRNTEAGPVNFLLFGSLQRRKGIEELLDAMEHFPPEHLEDICLTICGEGELAGLIAERAEVIRTRGGRIMFDNRFLAEAELHKAILDSHAFVAPYRNHIGASGMLYIAAQYKRLVVAQHDGLMGRQVRRYGLGEAVRSSEPAEIAAAMVRMMKRIKGAGSQSRPDFSAYLESHGAMSFSEAAYAHALRQN